MSKKKVVVGIITCRRPLGLHTLLMSLSKQELSSQNAETFDVSVVVVDNDASGGGEAIVRTVREGTDLKVSYCQELTPGIPFARNKSIEAAGDCDAFIFVDDDEVAPSGWLDALLTMQRDLEADIVTGPVNPILPQNVPNWAEKSGVFVKNQPYRRGQVLTRAFTNNTLVSSRVLKDLETGFDPSFQYTGSSDLHYFMRARDKGYKIYWCPEAKIDETIPLSRIRFAWVLKRGARIGIGETKSVLLMHPTVKTVLGVLYRSLGRMVLGGAQLLLFPVTKWRGVVFGCRRIATGIGGILGLFGIRYQEYKNIHGE